MLIQLGEAAVNAWKFGEGYQVGDDLQKVEAAKSLALVVATWGTGGLGGAVSLGFTVLDTQVGGVENVLVEGVRLRVEHQIEDPWLLFPATSIPGVY